MKNKDKIDLLTTLAIAQKESSCKPLNEGGIMQVSENGKNKDYSTIKQEDTSECMRLHPNEVNLVCCAISTLLPPTGTVYSDFKWMTKEECDKKDSGVIRGVIDKNNPEYSKCGSVQLPSNVKYEVTDDCRATIQIRDGIISLDVVYDSVKEENKKYGIKDELALLKFALLGYNRGGNVASKAMENYHNGMNIYDAMKHGCDVFESYQDKTDSSGYNLCTGRKEGAEDVRAYGAEYPNKVFEIYKKACKDMGGNYNEEAIA